MGELKTILWKKAISYEGYVSVQGIYRVARDWLKEHRFDPYEEKHTEQVFKDGKEIVIEMKGEKDLSDYAQIKWKSKFTYGKLQEKTVEKDGKKIRMHEGKVKIVTDVFLATDHQDSLENNAFMFFMRTVLDRFVFKSYIKKAEHRVRRDYLEYQNHLKSYLNMEDFS
ncbi:MAG: hypothetical protein ACOCQQ_03500 [Candidatus Nanoarchaeia archaeon]